MSERRYRLGKTPAENWALFALPRDNEIRLFRTEREGRFFLALHDDAGIDRFVRLNGLISKASSKLSYALDELEYAHDAAIERVRAASKLLQDALAGYSVPG